MFSKIVALCTLVVVAKAGLLAAPIHYSTAEAVSSQSIVRHDQPHAVATKLVAAAPIAYHSAPAQLAYHSAPSHYSAAEAVSSQSIIRHQEPAHLAVDAPAHITYNTAPAHFAYQAAPAHVGYHASPAAVSYHTAPAAVTYHAAPAAVAYHSAPVTKVVAHEAEEIKSHPQYEYNYSITDEHTGDIKSQQESRDGDVVKGSYSLHEADGSVRTVEYTADAHHGFNAVVHNSAATHVPVVVKSAAPIAYYHH